MKEAEVILKMTREEFLSDCHYFSDKYKKQLEQDTAIVNELIKQLKQQTARVNELTKQLEQDTARANELKKEIRTIIYKSRVG